MKIQVSLNSDKNNSYFTIRSIYNFDHISLRPSNDKCSDKSCADNQNTHFKFINFFQKSCHLWNYTKKYCRVEQATDDNTSVILLHFQPQSDPIRWSVAPQQGRISHI